MNKLPLACNTSALAVLRAAAASAAAPAVAAAVGAAQAQRTQGGSFVSSCSARFSSCQSDRRNCIARPCIRLQQGRGHRPASEAVH